MFRAVEWVLCVWQRLNDGLGKLGIPDVVFGPCQFLSCPIESKDPNVIHEYVKLFYNLNQKQNILFQYAFVNVF